MPSPLSHRLEDAVTHVNIDRQPDAVKHFFEALDLTPEGSVVEMNGKPVARMLPANGRNPEWTDAKTVRRLSLIDRDIAGTITSDETLELEMLQGSWSGTSNASLPYRSITSVSYISSCSPGTAEAMTPAPHDCPV